MWSPRRGNLLPRRGGCGPLVTLIISALSPAGLTISGSGVSCDQAGVARGRRGGRRCAGAEGSPDRRADTDPGGGLRRSQGEPGRDSPLCSPRRAEPTLPSWFPRPTTGPGLPR